MSAVDYRQKELMLCLRSTSSDAWSIARNDAADLIEELEADLQTEIEKVAELEKKICQLHSLKEG